MQSKSLWMDTSLPDFPPLNSDIHVDVCIVGAGIAGLTSAYTLAKEGKSVAIIDQGPIGGEESARTTAHLTWILDERYYQLVDLFGKDGAKLAADSHSAAIDYIEKVVQNENIDCDFERVDGHLSFTDKEMLDKEYETIKKLGRDVFKEDSILRFPRQAQFHILKYLKGLTGAILANHGKIFSNTHAESFEDGKICTVKTKSGFKITSSALIVATGTPVNNRFFIHTKQAPYRTYVIAAPIPQDSVPKGLFWDTEDPYHYVRTHANWLIVGGEDHKTGQDDKCQEKYDSLEKWARKRFPNLGKVEYRWSGQIYEPIDSLGFIGKNPQDQNIYIATGDNGNGMTNGTIAGVLLPDLILGKDNPWKDLYEPSRKTFSAAPKFIQENLNVALQYADWLTPAEVQEIESLSPGDGVIIRKGIKKLAVCKDQQNKLHINSAFCPHLGGCVRWNPGEKTWDCPCHGSRFDHTGKVINGPAVDDLSS